jgi:alpha-methylacyl-CoA racemase
VDILIDPFRPGVLERLGLSPALLLQRNPRLIIARMTGFRRSGKYKDMAGHDINYLAVSGILSMIGPKAPGLPLPPGNILADFAGGGAMCFLGILLALFSREKTGKGQVVEANMVDGAAYLGTMPRLGLKSEIWRRERGENTLDGGCPYYGTYACKDGGIMSVGALEPQFFALLLKGLGLSDEDIMVEKGSGGREDRRNWPRMKRVFTETFLSKTRREWEDVFDGTDACVAPVLFFRELESAGYEQKVPVDLVGSPGLKVESGEGGWSGKGLSAGVGGEETLRGWVGWERGKQYEVEGGALVLKEGKSKL